MALLDIMRCIDERRQMPFDGVNDELVELLFDDSPNDCMFVAVKGMFNVGRHNKLIPEGYVLRCVFELGTIMADTQLPQALYWFTKTKLKECKFSLMDESLRRSLLKNRRALSRVISSDVYLEYLRSCERYVVDGGSGAGLVGGQFYSVKMPDLVDGRYDPEYYSPKILSLRKELDGKDVVKLADVAEVVRPKEVKGGLQNVLVMRGRDVKLPLVLEDLEEGGETSVVLRDGDLVLTSVGDVRAVVYEGAGDRDVYAGQTCYVVRSHSVSAEYLCLYLSSEVAKLILMSYMNGVYIKHLSLQALRDFPIVRPQMGDEYYRAEYAILAGSASRCYEDLSSLRSDGQHIVEAVLDREIASRITAYVDEQLRTFLSSDIDELNACFSAGAYKAAIILAGSILEAVLIDWLSEIDHVNYFKKRYYVRDSRTGRDKPADLFDYINEIKYIEKPRWVKEAEMAHKIRKKRNLVHAQLCISEGAVGEESARMVIDYLEQVLKTRGICSVRG
jgi:hypothetical protein